MRARHNAPRNCVTNTCSIEDLVWLLGTLKNKTCNLLAPFGNFSGPKVFELLVNTSLQYCYKFARSLKQIY